MKKLLIAIVLGLLIPSVAGAATYYVAKTGSNSNSCTQAQSQSTPKLTIASGLACLSPGDTLQIKAGTYAESIDKNQVPSGTSWSSATTIQSFGSDVVTLAPKSGSSVISFTTPGTGITKRYIVFKGGTPQNFIFDAGFLLDAAISVGGGANGGTVDHIRFDGIEAKRSNQSLVFVGDEFGNGDFSEVLNSKIHDNGTGGQGGPYNHAIYSTASNLLVEHNEIYNITGYGIHNYGVRTSSGNRFGYNLIHNFGLSRDSTGILLWDGSNHQAYRNIVRNGTGGGISTCCASTGSLVYNNTVYQNSATGCASNSSTNAVFKNNICYLNGQNLDTTGSGAVFSNNLTTYPSFVDIAGNDCTLQAGSPAIDAGTSSITTSVKIASYSGSAPDIGAYEYGSLVSSVGTSSIGTSSIGTSSIGTSSTIAPPAPPSNLAVVSP